MTDPRDVARYEGVARIANYFGAGVRPRMPDRDREGAADEPTPGDHLARIPTSPSTRNESVDGKSSVVG